MEISPVRNTKEMRYFFTVPHAIYKGNIYRRETEESIVRLICKGPSAFHMHATVIPCLIFSDGRIIGRCAFIHDRNLSDTVQVAFFEIHEGPPDVAQELKKSARRFFPDVGKIVIGLNGHLNYGAGFLLNHFDKPPVFGLPYSAEYYPRFFSSFHCRTSVSYRFPLSAFYAWKEAMKPGSFDTQGITVRFMNKKNLKREVALYTHIDNTSFSNTDYWYWSNRTPEENYELFSPFSALLDGENLILAEKDGDPVGFLLWYPDFNELTGPGRDLGLADVLRFRFTNRIRTIRFTEVALLPRYRKSPAVMMMILKMIEPLRRYGYEFCEGGFIFEENLNSMVMTRRFLQRSFGMQLEPYRKFGIFEGML